MKIVLLSMNFAPELTGIGKYSGEMADALVARGHEVVVVCAPPYYPAWQVDATYSNQAWTREEPKRGLTILRCPVWVPRRPGGLARLLHLASFALSSFPVMMRLAFGGASLFFVVAPALFCAPTGWLAAKIAGARSWLHIQDFELDAAFGLGLLKGDRVRDMVISGEGRLMRAFDRVSTISRQMSALLRDKGVAQDRTHLLPNWIDLDRVRPGARSPEMRSELGIQAGQVVCLYSGTLNRKQGLESVIGAARLLSSRTDIVFVICGNGELRPSLESAARGLANVRFLDLQPIEKLNALLNMADVHLLPQLQAAADLVMPSKLAGMLASGRPVVAGAAPGTEIALVVEGRGIVTQPESAPAFAQAIEALAEDPARRELLGRAARDYAVHSLGLAAVMDQLEMQFERLCADEVAIAPAVA